MADTTIKKSTQVKLTYTAVDLAKEMGTSDRNLSQNWLPKLEEIFWWKLPDLKEGERYSAWAREEFFNLQAAISPKIPMRSPDGIILRDDSGKPLMQGNPDRIGINDYKQQIWQRYNRVPEKRIDAPSAIVPVEVMDADLIDREEAALEKVDSLGEFVNLNLDQLRQAGRSLGQEIGATFLEEMSTSAEETIKSGLNSLGKALSPRKKKS
jgi:tetrahydromethanopterin S-methyltransferase subunit G